MSWRSAGGVVGGGGGGGVVRVVAAGTGWLTGRAGAGRAAQADP